MKLYILTNLIAMTLKRKKIMVMCLISLLQYVLLSLPFLLPFTIIKRRKIKKSKRLLRDIKKDIMNKSKEIVILQQTKIKISIIKVIYSLKTLSQVIMISLIEIQICKLIMILH